MTQFATVDLHINAGWPVDYNGWKAGMDYNLVALSFLSRGIADNMSTTTLPGSPVVGEDCFIVGAGATGALAGKDHYIAFYGESWHYLAPFEGARFFITDLDAYYEYRSGVWVESDTNRMQVKRVTGTTYTVLTTDSGLILDFTANSAVALTIPAFAEADGFSFGVIQSGTGQVTFGGAATLVNYDGHTKTAGQHAAVVFVGLNGAAVNFTGRTA